MKPLGFDYLYSVTIKWYYNEISLCLNRAIESWWQSSDGDYRCPDPKSELFTEKAVLLGMTVTMRLVWKELLL
jgi:hypothetical protein